MVTHDRMERFRTQRHAILFPLPVAPAHLVQTEIDILHAQPEPLDQTQAAALQELSDPLVDACGGQDDAPDLVCGQHDGPRDLLVARTAWIPASSNAMPRTSRERNSKA